MIQPKAIFQFLWRDCIHDRFNMLPLDSLEAMPELSANRKSIIIEGSPSLSSESGPLPTYGTIPWHKFSQ